MRDLHELIFRSIGPGLRLGYMVVPRHLICSATIIRALTDNGAPWLEQATLAAFIRDGSLANHLYRIRHTYRGRRDVLTRALHRHFGEVEISSGNAGSTSSGICRAICRHPRMYKRLRATMGSASIPCATARPISTSKWKIVTGFFCSVIHR